jgi:hypothetical protein
MGRASSSSLEGTSKTLAPTGDVDGGLPDVDLLATRLNFSDPTGAVLGDSDDNGSLSPRSGVCDFRASDAKL